MSGADGTQDNGRISFGIGEENSGDTAYNAFKGMCDGNRATRRSGCIDCAGFEGRFWEGYFRIRRGGIEKGPPFAEVKEGPRLTREKFVSGDKRRGSTNF